MKGKLDYLLERVLVLIMAVMVLNVIWQVASRYLLASPSVFTDELAGFLLIWVGLLGSGYGTGKGIHMAIDLLPTSLVGKRKQSVVSLIHGFVIAFAVLILIVGGGNLVFVTFELKQLSSSLHLPLWCVYLAIPVSGLLMVYYSLYFLLTKDSDGGY